MVDWLCNYIRVGCYYNVKHFLFPVGFQIELLELSMKDDQNPHPVMVEEIGGVKKLDKDEILLVPSKKRSKMLCGK